MSQAMQIAAHANVFLVVLAALSVLFGITVGFAHFLEVRGISKGCPRDSLSLSWVALGVILILSGVHVGYKTFVLWDVAALVGFFLFLFWVCAESVFLMCRAALRL